MEGSPPTDAGNEEDGTDDVEIKIELSSGSGEKNELESRCGEELTESK